MLGLPLSQMLIGISCTERQRQLSTEATQPAKKRKAERTCEKYSRTGKIYKRDFKAIWTVRKAYEVHYQGEMK